MTTTYNHTSGAPIGTPRLSVYSGFVVSSMASVNIRSRPDSEASLTEYQIADVTNLSVSLGKLLKSTWNKLQSASMANGKLLEINRIGSLRTSNFSHLESESETQTQTITDETYFLQPQSTNMRFSKELSTTPFDTQCATIDNLTGTDIWNKTVHTIGTFSKCKFSHEISSKDTVTPKSHSHSKSKDTGHGTADTKLTPDTVLKNDTRLSSRKLKFFKNISRSLTNTNPKSPTKSTTSFFSAMSYDVSRSSNSPSSDSYNPKTNNHQFDQKTNKTVMNQTQKFYQRILEGSCKIKAMNRKSCDDYLNSKKFKDTKRFWEIKEKQGNITKNVLNNEPQLSSRVTSHENEVEPFQIEVQNYLLTIEDDTDEEDSITTDTKQTGQGIHRIPTLNRGTQLLPSSKNVKDNGTLRSFYTFQTKQRDLRTSMFYSRISSTQPHTNTDLTNNKISDDSMIFDSSHFFPTEATSSYCRDKMGKDSDVVFRKENSEHKKIDKREVKVMTVYDSPGMTICVYGLNR